MGGDEPGAIQLSLDGNPVATYVWRPSAPLMAAPRPYLHPVRTIGGIEVTELMPADHRHHLGVSLAVADVDGHNFWGGRTYVRGSGPTMLDNHGVQRHAGWVRRTPSELVQSVAWVSRTGTELLREQRTIAVRPESVDRWALELGFTCTNVGVEQMVIGSPATNGRVGAGYGGLFWRAPATSTGIYVFGPDGAGEEAVHGSRSSWLALTGHDGASGGDRAGGADSVGGRGWSLVFLPADEETAGDPWFVRTKEYPGVGSSLAWDRPLILAPGAALTRTFVILVSDGVLDGDGAARLAATTLAGR